MKRYYQLTIAIFSVLLLNSCNSPTRLLKGGEVQKGDFYTVFDFEDFNDWIIVEATVNDETKPRAFLLDTGAPNVITPEVAQKIGAVAKSKDKVNSSTTQSRQSEFTTIDKVNIGGIDFFNTGSVIISFNSSNDMKCLGKRVDGIIGSNLMRKAFWQIDYSAKKIIITNDFEKLKIDNNAHMIPFVPTKQGTPQVEMKAGGETMKLRVDTGKRGGFGAKSSYLKKIQENEKDLNSIKGIGQVSSGIFGVEIDTSYLVQISEFAMGDLTMDTVIFSFHKTASHLLGNTFLKHFVLTFDWEKSVIYFSPKSIDTWDKNAESFGFGYTVKEGKLLVDFLYENGAAKKKGLQLDDQILSINGKTYAELTVDDYCNFRNDGLVDEDIKKMTIEIQRGEERFTIEVEQAFLF